MERFQNNIVVNFQPNILRIVGFYVRHSAIDGTLSLPGNWGHLDTTKAGSYSQVLRYALHFPDRLPDVHTLPRVGQFLLFLQYWHV